MKYIPVVFVGIGIFLSTLALPTEVLAKEKTSIDVQDVVTVTNRARQAEGQLALTPIASLMQAAQSKADLMANQSEFAHTLEDGTTAWELIRANGYQYRAVGENLAVHFGSAEEVVTAWLNSPTHRHNLMSNTYQDIGIGIAKGEWDGYDGYFIVQLFGSTIDS